MRVPAMLQRAFVLAVLSVAPGAQTLIWPGDKFATIDAEHLRAYVPYEHREHLKDLVARADQIYAHMMQDAGFTPRKKLRLLLADWLDEHNGFSFVVPFPLVQVELAPALAESTIFHGDRDTERTLVHEFAHQISNDRNWGFRGALESVFGAVLPGDLLSFLIWYLSTPAHQTMPRFWQEGLAVWAETEYANPQDVWAGRGRDPLTHMVWRLDAAAGGIPSVDRWRITYHRWPFGGEAYTYGIAYTRFLAAHFGDRTAIWNFVATQARQWPFVFSRGAKQLVGAPHSVLIEAARAALLEEQQAALATLRSVPVTTVARLTPKDMLVGTPAWGSDGSLTFAARPQQGRPRLHTLSASNELSGSATPTQALGARRRTQDGALVAHEFNWRGIAQVHLEDAVFGSRLLQPDASARDAAGRRSIVAIHLAGGGVQQLVLHEEHAGELSDARVLATRGRPWSPALRPGVDHRGELVWVETDASGSRLVLGSPASTAQRRELTSVRGRILHPTWTQDGAQLFFCSDHTGVVNAYCASFSSAGAVTVLTVTNTIGGVIACVPSPDGKTLAIVDHDADGPFIAKLPAVVAAQVTAPQITAPQITLAWPAPVAASDRPSASALSAATPIPPLPAGAANALTASAYSGLEELRPLFWSPTTFAVPEGGYGVSGLAADPLFTQVVQAGAGVGLTEQQPVGFLAWDCLALPVEFGATIGRSERSFSEIVRTASRAKYDYTETVTKGEVRVGRGLFALERTFILRATLGFESHDAVRAATRRYAGQTLTSKPAFTQTEGFVELALGYDDATFYPTSYTREDGFGNLGGFRHSGLGGQLERNLAFADLNHTWSIFPTAGHQVATRAQVGWSDGDDTLQGNYGIGGGLGRGLPRGYFAQSLATGRHLLAGSLAYRFPLSRPFAAPSTEPFRSRQFVVEVFGDTAKVSDNHIGGSGAWFTSVGTELHANLEFFDGILSPGIGIAYQLDGERQVQAYFAIGFAF